MSDTSFFRNGRKYNCPNCAAPITNLYKCDYCGTMLDWIPMQKIDIKILPVRAVPLREIINVPAELERVNGENSYRYAYEELSKSLMRETMKYATILRNPNHRLNSMEYRGELIVCDAGEINRNRRRNQDD